MSAKLDINTERGKQTVEDEATAIEILLANWHGIEWKRTKKDGDDACARVDGIFTRGEEIASVAEVKCRYDVGEKEFWATYSGLWMISNEKIIDLMSAARLLGVPGFGILYLVSGGLVMVKKICDCRGNACEKFDVRMMDTKATCNGGKKRDSVAFIPMHKSKRYGEIPF